MTITYKEIDNLGYKVIEKNDDGIISWIPVDPANSDYQAYLNPVEHLTGPNKL